MLARRVAKGARAPTGDKPPASTSRASGVIFISPKTNPQRSPHSSPQCKSVIHFSLAGIGVRILIADLAGFAEGEQQQEEPLRATPDMLPPPTTPTRGVSPTRASTNEATRMEEEVVGTCTGDSVLATDVSGEGDASSPLIMDPPLMD